MINEHFYLHKNANLKSCKFAAEETGFEPARAVLRAQGISNPPQWANYATPPSEINSRFLISFKYYNKHGDYLELKFVSQLAVLKSTTVVS